MRNVRLFHHPNPCRIPVKHNAESKSVSLLDYLAERCPSLVGHSAQFHPSPYLFNGHLQTMYAAMYKDTATADKIVYERELLRMANGGQVSLDWTLPASGAPAFTDSTPTLVILHGLTGGSHEAYIRGLLEVVTRPPFNYRGVVMNARGCCNTDILTPQLFNGAWTDDLRECLAHLQKKLAPGTPLIGIGYSLGSNILVKYLGEEGDKTPFKAAISVANPFDFLVSSNALERGFLSKHVYTRAMANNLKRLFEVNKEMMAQRQDISYDQVMAAQSIREFDDACTRKVFGYTTVNNYYREASSSQFIEHVKVPLLCLNAMDDPIATPECIPWDEIKINPYVVLATTEHGGHLGWFEHFYHPSRWVDKPLAEFIVAMFEAYDPRFKSDSALLDPQTIMQNVDTIKQHH
ncbi:Alpha/Beta hydrolase protein [Radiomyces spectabilis]|uniref:Alpha/Beta hydrolase protein n=1 Tax=Radiomyces spectabilis TaxID=64574 RepID=UPI0022202659|nr:Alpha/Beta hydrolase protein [Radiomyces spectabilis]KAI8376086.1 Alpha/Beta hydrolase protein [Radiomyces spectabilis]